MWTDFWHNEWIQHMIYAGLGAGFLAVAVTVAIETWGGRIGGILATVPSTIVPASLGLWYSSPSVEAWSHSLAAVPIGMMLNALFLWTWRIFPPLLPQNASIATQGLMMSGISLGIWSGCVSLWIYGSQWIEQRYIWAISATVLSIGVSLWITIKPSLAPKGNQKASWWTLLSRGFFAAVAIATAVYIAQHGQGTLAGIASVFPAIFWTSMLSLWLTQGAAVPSGAVAPMMLGSSSVSVYALILPYLAVKWTIWGGIIGAWLIAILIISIPSYLWLHARNRTVYDTVQQP